MIKKCAEYFETTAFTVWAVRKLAKEEGILFLQTLKEAGNFQVPQPFHNLFYHDDEYSRVMPGQKDYVSIGRNKHAQKRLLLCNLKELHTTFKTKFPEAQISFSKFCSLRPKWCIFSRSIRNTFSLRVYHA